MPRGKCGSPNKAAWLPNRATVLLLRTFTHRPHAKRSQLDCARRGNARLWQLEDKSSVRAEEMVASSSLGRYNTPGRRSRGSWTDVRMEAAQRVHSPRPLLFSAHDHHLSRSPPNLSALSTSPSSSSCLMTTNRMYHWNRLHSPGPPKRYITRPITLNRPAPSHPSLRPQRRAHCSAINEPHSEVRIRFSPPSALHVYKACAVIVLTIRKVSPPSPCPPRSWARSPCSSPLP
ncbi:hypothetical protein C8Q73DRAFT_289967 [Cubamyces lactineus]|nr:hypothetical protein C8Q73DRAFT_289967 [Cubamyces lactineus]